MPTLSSAPCLDTPASNRGRFRALSSRPGRAPQDLQLIGALNQEWDRMLGSPEVDARVRRWSDQHVALRGLHTLGELWAAGREHRRKEASDELLHALVACAQDGEQLAGRVVVQLFLGRAVRLIRSQVPATGAESMEVEAQVVAALWQAVASYPLANRPQRVAANLSMEMLRFTQQRWAGVSISTGSAPGHTVYERPFDETTDAGMAPVTADEREASAAWVRVVRLLSDAVAHGALTRDQALVLQLVYAPLEGQPQGVSEVAAHLSLSPDTLRRRLSRLTARLTTYVERVEREGPGGSLSPTRTPRLGAEPSELMRAA